MFLTISGTGLPGQWMDFACIVCMKRGLPVGDVAVRAHELTVRSSVRIQVGLHSTCQLESWPGCRGEDLAV